NVAVQFVDTTGNAALNAPNGSIFNGPINAGPNGITAGQLQLSAGVGIGTAGSPLLTNVKSVEASAGTGGVHLVNVSSLTIGNSSSNGITAMGGGIDVFAHGSLTLAGPVDLKGPGNIVLGSSGDVNIQADGSVSVDPAAGNITINAG